jgi:RHS repeat-associated protein
MRYFYLKFSFAFLISCFLLGINALDAMTLSRSVLDDIAKDKVKDKTNPIKPRNEKGGKNDGSKKDDALPVASKNRRKLTISSENFKKENLREKIEVFSISNKKGIQPLITSFASKSVLGPDPFRFSISSSKDSVKIGEEFELTITVDWVDFGVNNGVKFLPEWYKYVLKIVMPRGFVQTGGDYVDYCTKIVDAENSKAIFTIRGRFEYISENSVFKVLRGFEGANNLSEFIFKEEINLILKESNIQAKNGFNNRPSSSRMAGCTLNIPIIRMGLTGNNTSIIDSLYFLSGQKIVLQNSNYCAGTLHWSNGAIGFSVDVYPTATTTYTAYCQSDSCSSANSTSVKVIKTNDCSKVTIGRPEEYYYGTTNVTKNIFINLGDSLTLESKYNCTLYNSTTEYSDGTSIFIGGTKIAPTSNKKYYVRCKNGSCLSISDTLNVFVQCDNVPIPTLTYYNGGSSEFPIHYAQANGCAGTIKWYNGSNFYLGTGNRILLSDVPGYFLNYPRASCTINNCTSNLSDDFNRALIPFDPIIDYLYPRIGAGVNGSGQNSFSTIDADCGESVIITPVGCRNDKPKEIYIYTYQNSLTTKITTYLFEGSSVKIPMPINADYSITQSSMYLVCYRPGATQVTWANIQGSFKSFRDSAYKVPIRAENNTICTGGTGVLYAENCGGTVQWQNRVTTASWSNSVTGDTISVSPTVNTFYRAKCISEQCPNNPWSDSLSINIDALINAPVSPVIVGDTLIYYSLDDPFNSTGAAIRASCSGSIVWSTGQEGDLVYVRPNVTSSYTARCRYNGCLSQPSKPVVVNICNVLAPTVTISKDTVYRCDGNVVTITLGGCSNNYNYYISYYDEMDKLLYGLQVDSVSGIGVLSYTKIRASCIPKNGIGCSTRLSNFKIIHYIGPTTPVVTGNGSTGGFRFCHGQNMIFNATNCLGITRWYQVPQGSGSYVYAASGNTYSAPPLVFAPGETSTYQYLQATCTENNCEGSGFGFVINVTKTPTPVITTTTPSQICSGANVALSVAGCDNGIVLWNGVNGGINMTVNPVKDTTFTAVCIVSGCESPNSNTLSFTIKPTPTQLTVSPTTLTICPGDTATLTASACVGYVQWSNGVNGQVLKVVPSATTSYTAKCINSCAVAGPNSSPTNVTIEPLSKPVISALKSLLCSNGIHQDGTITLTATGCAYTVQWSNGLFGNSITFPTSVTKKFSAVCVRNNCISPPADSLQITVLSIPLPPSITVSNRYKCVGVVRTDNVTAQGYNGGLQWYANSALLTDTTKIISVNPTVTTKYYTTSTNICGTSNPSPMDSIVIVPIPSITSIALLNKPYPFVCNNDPNDKLQIMANGCPGVVEWTGGELTGQNITGTTIFVKPIINTTYSARCNDHGCLSIYRDFQTEIAVDGILSLTVFPSIIPLGGMAELNTIPLGAPYKWFTYSNLTTPFLITNTPTITVSPTVTTSYFVKANGNCSELSTQSTPVTVTLDVPPVPTITSPISSICEGTNSSIQLSATGCGTGTLLWYNGATTSTIMVTPTFTTTYSAKCVSTFGNTGVAGTKTITVNAPPTINAYPVSVKAGEIIKLNVDVTPAGTYTYNWTGPSSFTSTTQNPQVTASAVKATHQGFYTIKIGGASICTAVATVQVTIIDAQCGCDDCATLVTTDPFSIPRVAITGKNYIVENLYLTALTAIPTTAVALTQTISYVDGLGRPIQKTAVKAGPGQEDLVSIMEYDVYGREAIKRLPFAISGNGGQLVMQPLEYIKNYYSKDPAKQADKDFAFAQTIFEPSPLNRVTQQGSPGAVWQTTADPTLATNHTIRMGYFTNSKNGSGTDIESLLKDNVKLFTFPSITTTIEAQTVVVSLYDANQLMVNITSDENGNKMAECKDKLGQVVCKRVQNLKPTGETEIIETNYAYDDFGLLRFVFQPKASATLAISVTAITPLSATATINELVFGYNYDVRFRQIEKKIPGTVKTELVYDKRDRLVYAIDGWGRSLTPTTGRSRGVYTRYDELNRITESGYYTVIANQNCGVPAVNSSTNPRAFLQCSYDAMTTTNYDFLATASTTNKKAYLNNSYDTYLTADASKFNLAHAYNQARLTNLKGMLVKTIDQVLINDAVATTTNILNPSVTTVMFYDNLARGIQAVTLNHTNKTDIVSSQLDFAGRVTFTKSTTNYTWKSSTTTTTALPAIVIENKTTYDYGGRVASICQKNDADTWEPVVRNTYSKIGELIAKKMGCNIQNVDYQYNIRSWLTKINDPANLAGNNKDLFGLNLSYNSGAITPQYNGNITKLEWNTLSKLDNVAAPKGLQAYEYTYDKVNRLLSANFSSPIPALSALGISVAMSNGTNSYDVNGNIQYLKRTVNSVVQDNLTYMYEGTNQLSNRLLKIDDAGIKTDANYFVDGNTTNDYTYTGNGNMLSDANKLITNITYTHANLPIQITVGGTTNAGKMKYYYTFSGKKVRTEVLVGASASNFTEAKTIEYVNGLGFKGGTLEFIPTVEGRALTAKYVWSNGTSSTAVALTPPVAPANQYRYEYQLKDHLGDLRVSCRCGDPKRNAAGDMIAGLEPTMAVQENHYDPWGVGFADATSSQIPVKNTDRFQYNGQEKIIDLGIGLYDYGARHYDPTNGRFISVDPLAEVSRRYSTYAYVFDNPIKLTDPDGMSPTTDAYGLKTGFDFDVAFDDGDVESTVSNNKNKSKYYDTKDAKIKITLSVVNQAKADLSKTMFSKTNGTVDATKIFGGEITTRIVPLSKDVDVNVTNVIIQYVVVNSIDDVRANDHILVVVTDIPDQQNLDPVGLAILGGTSSAVEANTISNKTFDKVAFHELAHNLGLKDTYITGDGTKGLMGYGNNGSTILDDSEKRTMVNYQGLHMFGNGTYSRQKQTPTDTKKEIRDFLKSNKIK